MEKLTQAQYMREYNDIHRDHFNPIFFQRSNQEIMDCVKKVVLSCERDKYFTLKVLSMREIYDYEEIMNTLRDYEQRLIDRKKGSGKKRENQYDYINIKDSDIMLLEVKWEIHHNDVEIQTVEGEETLVRNPWTILTSLIALPRFTKKYYFRLNGNYYSDIFQIVDGSTYNNVVVGASTKKAACNSFKTIFTPIRIFRKYVNQVDYLSKEPVRLTVYTSIIPLVFNNHMNCMFYLFANFGFHYINEFLGIDCVVADDKPIEDDGWYNFEKHGIFVSFPKVMKSDPMVQAMTATILEAIRFDTTLDDLYDPRFWIRLLGRHFGNDTIEKGLFILDTLDGIYDIITKEELHLPENYKADIYMILRWLMREFKYIRNKSNIDVNLKRYRIGEPIAAIYADKLIRGLSRVTDMGKKVTLFAVERAINIDPMFVVNRAINMTNLVDYRDMVNDNDAMTALKWTYKGISGLGESGSKIPQTYRYVDPSYVGILDLDSSTTSDPGMSGTLCPFAKVYPGNSFSEYEEPNFWEAEYGELKKELDKTREYLVKPVSFQTPPVRDLREARKRVIAENIEITKPICPLIDVESGLPYTSVMEKLKEEQKEAKQIKSLFTIHADPEDDDDYYDEYD